jgi:hypothetical protein
MYKEGLGIFNGDNDIDLREQSDVQAVAALGMGNHHAKKQLL